MSFVTRGSVRRKVIKGLLRPTTTTELAKMIGVDRAAVNRTIHAMEKVGLVECLTPEEIGTGITGQLKPGRRLLRLSKGWGNNFSGGLTLNGALLCDAWDIVNGVDIIMIVSI